MKIAFIGAVEMSRRLLETTLESEDAEVVGVVTRGVSGKADLAPLTPLAREAGIAALEIGNNDSRSIAGFLRKVGCDIAYCFGWPFLLSGDVLDVPEGGIVGFHPASLPKNRGRHPIIWALELGLDKTGSTFFQMDELADHGPILSQVEVSIRTADDAGSLYGRIGDTACEQVRELTHDLAMGTVAGVPQAHEFASYWRRRGKDDGRIDMRMSATGIYNLVRALTRPYPGAHCVTSEGDVKVWQAEPVEGGSANDEPGKILDADDGIVTVRCGDGAVRLLEHEFSWLPPPGSYL